MVSTKTEVDYFVFCVPKWIIIILSHCVWEKEIKKAKRGRRDEERLSTRLNLWAKTPDQPQSAHKSPMQSCSPGSHHQASWCCSVVVVAVVDECVCGKVRELRLADCCCQLRCGKWLLAPWSIYTCQPSKLVRVGDFFGWWLRYTSNLQQDHEDIEQRWGSEETHRYWKMQTWD